ncbi:hypothetical protein OROGR_006266 [Orobanche gracilis]
MEDLHIHEKKSSVFRDIWCFIRGKDLNSKGWHLVNWETVTDVKANGGLGIRDARKGNIALLGKLIWKMIHDADCIWVRLLKGLYLRDADFLKYEIKGNVSYLWRSIIKARDALRECFSFMLQDGNSSFWYDDWSGLGVFCDSVPFVHVSDTELQVKDVWRNGWDWNHVWTFIHVEIRPLLADIQGPSGSIFPDAWRCTLRPDGNYTTAAGYAHLNALNRPPNSHPVWKRLWKLMVHEKCKFFMWLALHDSVPSNAYRHHCHLSPSAACARCSASVEDTVHCLRDCPHAKELWLRSGCDIFPNFFSLNRWDWLSNVIMHKGAITYIINIWWIWRWRNDMCLGTKSWTLGHVQRNITTDRLNLQLISATRETITVAPLTMTTWRPPDQGWLKLNTDGSYAASSSHISCGGSLRDHDGNWVSGFSSFERVGDVFMAELLGIVRGLYLAWSCGGRKIICETDNLDVATCLNRSGPTNLHSCAALLAEVRYWLNKDWEVLIKHISRDLNHVADELARIGMRNKDFFKRWISPPPSVIKLLVPD